MYDINCYQLITDAPFFLFIHGGYWQCLSKNDYGHCALALTLKSGYRVMIANYSLCPKITLQQLVNQAKNLIQFCLQFTVNTNAKFLSIAGHSAGAHLILAALSDLDFVTQNTLSLCSKLKHLYLISGVYDLSQLRFVPSINKDNLLSLTDENVKQLSPYFCDFSHLKGFKAKFYFVLGEHESDTFKRQSHEMMEILLNNVELDTEYEVLRGLDHFSIIENLNLENFYLVQKLTEDNREPDPSNCEIVTKYSSSQLESRYGDESQNEFVVFSKSSYVK